MHHQSTLESTLLNTNWQLYRNISNSDRIVFYKLLKLAFDLSIVFSVGSYAWYLAVTRIPMPDLTAIYDSSCVFVYILAIFLLGEEITVLKVVSVGITFIGVLFISMDGISPDAVKKNQGTVDMVFGYFAAFASSICVSLYEVLYKKYAVPPPPRSASTFFSFHLTGLIGLMSLVILWPVFIVLHVLRLEEFEPPMISFENLPLILCIAINVGFGLTYNVTFNLLVAIAGPVFASIGIMLTIPLLVFVDWIFTGTFASVGMVTGSLAILIGFCGMSIS
ncbi:hypothetical protein HK098_007688 [Nowakowskiella sp. JEL0407]|nr:hypothetical protein HK098_007688 [Nowakowskiella sp. JEL0407]